MPETNKDRIEESPNALLQDAEAARSLRESNGNTTADLKRHRKQTVEGSIEHIIRIERPLASA